jgi:hypothetical protein
MNPFVVCAFYTPNYRDDVKRLEISLKAAGHEYFIQPYERLPTWEQNTGIKPRFLLDCLRRFESKDILYLDADAFVRKPLEGFDRFEGDIGLHFNQNGGSHSIRTGTVYLRNSPQTLIFMQQWIDAQASNETFNDQDSFEVAYKASQGVSFFHLPVEYVKIYDRDDVEAYVEHFQASRRDEGSKVNNRQTRKRKKYLAIILATHVFYLTVLAFCL